MSVHACELPVKFEFKASDSRPTLRVVALDRYLQLLAEIELVLSEVNFGSRFWAKYPHYATYLGLYLLETLYLRVYKWSIVNNDGSGTSEEANIVETLREPHIWNNLFFNVWSKLGSQSVLDHKLLFSYFKT